MSRCSSVSRSGFHGWERRAPSDRALSDAWLTERIKEIHERARGVYGSRRVTAELRLGEGLGRLSKARAAADASGRDLRPGQGQAGQARRSGFPASVSLMTWSSATSRRRRRTCCGSRTSPTCRSWEGWLYLAAVQDAFSRMIVGWAMAEHMRAELVVDALKMGVHRRRPEEGLIHHSDLGSQYVSPGLRPASHETPASPSRWAHAVTPTTTPLPRASSPRSRRSSFTASHGRHRRELGAAVFEYIEALLQPPTTTLDPRLPLAAGVREQESHDHHDRLATKARDCPRKRVHSSAGGYEALEPHSRRPRSCEHETPRDVVEQIVKLRGELLAEGHDAGAETIAYHLTQRVKEVPSRSTIWRILRREGLVVAQRQKRPHSSLIRF